MALSIKFMSAADVESAETEHKVVIECFVIILILVIAGYMFVRSKRKAWLYGTFPLMLVPAVNIVLYSFLKDYIVYSDDTFFIRSTIYAISFLITSLWALLWAHSLPYGKSKYAYIICTISYTLILCLLLLFKGPHLR